MKNGKIFVYNTLRYYIILFNTTTLPQREILVHPKINELFFLLQYYY